MKIAHRIPMPRNKPGRVALGVAFVVGGILGFLPILGFWMIPLGLYMLSHDFPRVRRFRRRAVVRFGRWWQRRAGSTFSGDTARQPSPRDSVTGGRGTAEPLGKVRHL